MASAPLRAELSAILRGLRCQGKLVA